MKSKIITALALCFCVLTISAVAQKSKKETNYLTAARLTDAASKGDIKTLAALLDGGADVNLEEADFQGWTALMSATTSGQTGAVKFLISKGANARVRLKDGETTLIQAAQNENNREIVEALIKAGADVNVQTKKGLTALMRFAWMSQTEAVKLVLEAGADTKLKDKDGWTAFYFACSHGNDARIVKLLLDAGANPNETNAKGETPLMWLGWGDRTENFRALIAAGANVNTQDKDGRTPLMISAARFFRGEIKLLLDAKADVRAKDKKGWNALMYTAASGFRKDEFGAHGDGMIVWLEATKIIEELIAAGIEPNAQNADGETALMLAVKANNAHFAETLLAKGANPDIKDKKGKTANDYKAANYDKLREMLLKMSGRIK